MAKSQHVSDAFIEPFLRPSFDPATYLNDVLPGLSAGPAVPASVLKAGTVPLPELYSQTNALVSQLNTHTSRLSNVLTQMTDDILRSGGRLAYQVEVLRGETIGLSETLTESLQNDLATFGTTNLPLKSSLDRNDAADPKSPVTSRDGNRTAVTQAAPPAHLAQLRTLSQVRARLDSVIKVFGDAMHWTIPPSEVSLGSSLISVAAPEPGTENQSQEDKGREHAERIRREIADLVAGNDGYEAAMVRIEALRDLAQVWKGTSEEKARVKFVESLVKLADEKRRGK